MRTWKIVLIGTILSTALIFTIVRQGLNASERVQANTPAANKPTSFVTNPIVPADLNAPNYGPIRLTDW